MTYGGLLQDRRRQLHAQIVAATERLYPDRLSEHVERLAHHALRGHLWDKAVRYGRQAGTRALDRSALREALAAFEQARVALQSCPRAGRGPSSSSTCASSSGTPSTRSASSRDWARS